jgi:hypothetical protein
MKWLPHDLGTWGFILGIATLILMYPVGVMINMTTPLLQNWLATRTRASLDKRIAKLEGQLANLEQIPEIDAVQNQILWEIKSVKLDAMGNLGVVLMMILLGVSVITRGEAPAFIGFSRIVLVIVILNSILMLLKRYQHDFRYLRSPDVRKSLRTAITELKRVRDAES